MLHGAFDLDSYSADELSSLYEISIKLEDFADIALICFFKT